MSEPSVQSFKPKKDWTLSPPALNRLLDWLDDGEGSEGQKYLEMRRRLVAYFDRKSCAAPDELADETLNRVARRLEEEGELESDTPAKYCYVVARFVFLESLRETRKKDQMLDDIRRHSDADTFSAPQSVDEKEVRERMLSCLDQCTGKLELSNREIILRYYVGKERVKIENRRALAETLGITINALSIRACRIRDKLEGCVRQCVGPA